MHGREVVIVEVARSWVGRGHPEKGYYKDVHPNHLLGDTWVEVIERVVIPAEALRGRDHGLRTVKCRAVATTSAATPGCRRGSRSRRRRR